MVLVLCMDIVQYYSMYYTCIILLYFCTCTMYTCMCIMTMKNPTFTHLSLLDNEYILVHVYSSTMHGTINGIIIIVMTIL